MTNRSFILFRSVSAVALTIGFYALAIAMCVAIIGFNWLIMEGGSLGFLSLKLFLFSAIALYTIVVAVFPRREKFAAPGPLLEPSAHPQLFALVRDISTRSNQAMPAEVYLTHDMNAFVMERGGLLGMGRRRVLGVGLALLQTLDVEELRAVLAHEFGHYHGGDTRIGPWIHKTRSAIGRALLGLGSSFLRKPFEWYGMLFLRITQSVSRRQEFAADQLGAALAGREAMASGLKKVHALGPLSHTYWEQEVMPVVKRGFRPALAAGFSEFLMAPRIADASPKILAEVLQSDSTDVYDSHPCLKDRLAALGADANPPTPSERPQALSLLGSHADLEPLLFAKRLGIEPGLLNPLAWDDSGEKVHRPGMEENLKPAAEALAAIPFREYPARMADPVSLAKELREIGITDDPELRKQVLAQILSLHLMLSLCKRGWKMSSRPGSEVRCLPPDALASLPPVEFSDLGKELADGAASGAWQTRCESWGLA